MKDLKIIVTKNSKANLIAAKEFKKYYKLVTGKDLEITDRDGDFDVVTIGNETDNDYIQKLYLEKKIDKFDLRYGEDNFLIKSVKIDDKNVLLLSGGRPRANIYAVYYYFEKFASVKFFWDGERVPKTTSLPIEKLNVLEKPRFKYRGQRYFAHRGLHRFQAEHWSFEDWKQEIDWLLKKRLNFVSLFIGLDDLFQRAFPDAVGYESVEKEDFGVGYENRKSFWPLKYRGELRKKILDYLHDRDLISFENSGTLTHWNTKTPQEFLDKYHPTFFGQTKESGYSDQRALVWDIKDQKNFDLYFKLTETLVKEYSKEGFFYTIGFAERNLSYDKEENLRLKLYGYHKLALKLQEKYPNSKLMLCGWDFWFNNFSTSDMKSLFSTLDPDNAIIMDYTSDTYRKYNGSKWDIVNKYPHTFGLFHGYQMNSDIRGDYTHSQKRIKLTLKDDKCIGFVFWPELSHSDTFMLEYYPLNAWSPLKESLEKRLYNFCKDRYLSKDFDFMYSVWKKFFPIIELMHWNMDDSDKAVMPIEYFFNINWRYKIDTPDFYNPKLKKFLKNRKACINILENLINVVDTEDDMLKRDCFDIAKTVIGRYIHYSLVLAKKYYAKRNKIGNTDVLFGILNDCKKLIKILGDFLGCYPEYTLNDSLNKLKKVHDVPEDFAYVLKDNAYNGYCRSYVYELFDNLYLKEYDMFLSNLKTSMKTGEPIKINMKKEKAIFDGFLNKPLEDMKPVRVDVKNVLLEAVCCMKDFKVYNS